VTSGREPEEGVAPRGLRELRAAVPRFIPILRWLPAYDRTSLPPDVLAGITSWGVMVPVALAYASLAGLPPAVGLITAFAALGTYAIFATSRDVKVTTSSTVAVMSLSLVAKIA
jgi:MFS superfamily sulfate permease-like transporter